MRLALLIYGYATGCFSSRQIERATYDSLAFRTIACHGHPDDRRGVVHHAGGRRRLRACYIAQAVVDNETLLVVVPQVTQAVNDKQQVIPMLEQVQALPTGLNQPEQGLADSGYFSADNVAAGEQAGVEPLIAVTAITTIPSGPRASVNPRHCRPPPPPYSA